MKKYTQHALSAAYPAMLDAYIGILAIDIEAHGQHDLIVLYDGQILDGWHRYLACLQVNITPEFTPLSDNNDPVAFVRSKNGYRRHLVGSQRAASEVALREWAEVGRPNNMEPGSTLNSKPATNKEMAKSAGVSTKTIQQAKIATKAGYGKDIIDGKITAKAAAQKVNPPKQKLVPQPENPDEEYDHAEAERIEAQNTIINLSDENDRLKDQIAVGNLPETERTAGEIIKDLRAQIKILQATNDALVASRDHFQQENAQLKQQLARNLKQIERLKNAKTA